VQALELGQPGFDVERAPVCLELPAPPSLGFMIDEHTTLTNDAARQRGSGGREIHHVDAQTCHRLLEARHDAAQGHRAARSGREHHGDVEVGERLGASSGAEQVGPTNRRFSCEHRTEALIERWERVDRDRPAHPRRDSPPPS